MADVAGTIAGLDALDKRVQLATEAIVADVSHMFQAFSMRNAPIGVPGNSTNAPGDLARSIEVDGPHAMGAGVYSADVGPTVVTANPGPGGRVYNYGRQREFGGEITPKVRTYLVFKRFGTVYRRRSVYQAGAHYLGRARVDGAPFIETIVSDHLRVAVG